MTALYDVTYYKAGIDRQRKLACVRATRNAGPNGNWFAGDIFTPDRAAVRAALPHQWRKAFDRAMVWHETERPRATASLRDSRGRVIATLFFEGYVVPLAGDSVRIYRPDTGREVLL